jgi:hypothetical protein
MIVLDQIPGYAATILRAAPEWLERGGLAFCTAHSSSDSCGTTFMPRASPFAAIPSMRESLDPSRPCTTTTVSLFWRSACQ